MYGEVTKCRNVVERLFTEVFLHCELCNHYAPFKMLIMFRSTVSSHNAFSDPVHSKITDQDADYKRIKLDAGNNDDIAAIKHKTKSSWFY